MPNKVNKPFKNNSSIHPDALVYYPLVNPKINAFSKIKEISSPSKKEKSKLKKKIKNFTHFKRITMFLKNKPYSSVVDIISGLNQFQSKTTITRFIRKNNFKCQNPTKKIILTEKQKKDRIEFVKTNISRDWSKVIFSDGKNFNLRGPDHILNNGETPTMRKKC